MTSDVMAAAVDWLDAYREGDLEGLLDLHAENSEIECSYNGMKTISGRESLRAYWTLHLLDRPALRLEDLQPRHTGVAITYLTSDGAICSTLEFDANGRVCFLRSKMISKFENLNYLTKCGLVPARVHSSLDSEGPRPCLDRPTTSSISLSQL